MGGAGVADGGASRWEHFLLGRGHIWQEKRKSLLGFWGPMRVRKVKTAFEI